MTNSNPPTSNSTPVTGYGVNRRAALLLSAVFLAVGGAGVVLSYAALNPARRLHYLRQSALEYIEREDWRRAGLQLGNVVQLAPKDAEAWYQLGLVQLRGAEPGDTEAIRSAVQQFRRSLEVDPEYWPACRWLLELELRAGNWNEAQPTADRLFAIAPDHPILAVAYDSLPARNPERVNAAWEKLKNKDAQTALELVANGRAEGEFWDAESVRVAALAFAELGRRRDCNDLLRDVATAVPDARRLSCLRAELALLDDDPKAAADWASKAIGSTCEPTAQMLVAEANKRLAELRIQGRTPREKEHP